MGWGSRVLAMSLLPVSLGLGAWPVGLLLFLYLLYSFRRPGRGASVRKQEAFQKPGRPWGRYALGALFLLLSLIAAGAGGTYSPAVLFVMGMASLFWPSVGRALDSDRVLPVRDSVLLRSRVFPFSWHALVEVKLESQDQTRGISAMGGKILLFGGKSPALFQVVSVRALSYKHAEAGVIDLLRRETGMLSQRGAHLIPADSADAAVRLSYELERLNVGTEDFAAVASLPFEAAVFRVEDGRLVSHRAFNILDPNGHATVPVPDLKHAREPLFAEVVQEIGEKHGWPGPDALSPFLAALDATRLEPLADRIRTKGEAGGKVTVEAAGGAEVRVSRAQLRALAMIYR